MGDKTVDGLHPTHRSQHPLANAKNQTADRRLRNCRKFALAHRPRHSRAEMGSSLTQVSQRLAVWCPGIRLAARTAVGTAIHRFAEAQGRELVKTGAIPWRTLPLRHAEKSLKHFSVGLGPTTPSETRCCRWK